MDEVSLVKIINKLKRITIIFTIIIMSCTIGIIIYGLSNITKAEFLLPIITRFTLISTLGFALTAAMMFLDTLKWGYSSTDRAPDF